MKAEHLDPFCGLFGDHDIPHAVSLSYGLASLPQRSADRQRAAAAKEAEENELMRVVRKFMQVCAFVGSRVHRLLFQTTALAPRHGMSNFLLVLDGWQHRNQTASGCVYGCAQYATRCHPPVPLCPFLQTTAMELETEVAQLSRRSVVAEEQLIETNTLLAQSTLRSQREVLRLRHLLARYDPAAAGFY